MEIAKLILEYIRTLIWPGICIFLLLRFEKPIFQLIDKMFSQSEQVDIEVVGQKISIKNRVRAEAMKEVIQTAVATPEIKDNNVGLNNLIQETEPILEVLSIMNDDDIHALRYLFDKNFIKRKFNQYSAKRLMKIGLLVTAESEYKLTELGLKVIHLIGQAEKDTF